jgi:hypothetical protein
MHFHIVKMYKDKEVKKNVEDIFFVNVWRKNIFDIYITEYGEHTSVDDEQSIPEHNSFLNKKTKNTLSDVSANRTLREMQLKLSILFKTFKIGILFANYWTLSTKFTFNVEKKFTKPYKYVRKLHYWVKWLYFMF